MFASAPEIQDDDQFKNTPNNDRIGFVRKVLGIVSVQLIVTAIFSYIVYSSELLTEIVQNSIGLLVMFLTISLITSIAIICSKTVSRTVPYNYLALLLFVSIM